MVIAHSQGGIVLSMALDNLLSDLPRECETSFPLFPVPRLSLRLNGDLLADALGLAIFILFSLIA